MRDQYKGLDDFDIVADRQEKALPFYVALNNLTGDFNKSSAIRNANNFLATAAVLLGKKRYDRRGTVGSHNYMSVMYYPTLDDLRQSLPDYRFVALENTKSAVPMHRYAWHQNTVMVFGEEQRGLSEKELSLCDDTVSIPTMGTVRSLNVATASGIAMYDYCYKTLSLV